MLLQPHPTSAEGDKRACRLLLSARSILPANESGRSIANIAFGVTNLTAAPDTDALNTRKRARAPRSLLAGLARFGPGCRLRNEINQPNQYDSLVLDSRQTIEWAFYACGVR